MDVDDLRRFTEELRHARTLFGDGSKRSLEGEASARDNARRSIVAEIEIQAGAVITEEMITYKRPGTGIPVRAWDRILGTTAKRTIEADEVLQWEMLKEK